MSSRFSIFSLLLFTLPAFAQDEAVGGDDELVRKVRSAIDNGVSYLRSKQRKADGREPMPNWTLHDLRRSARTLMSRAKVDADHAERCLGHVMAVVRGTYDCWAFLDEKRAVFAALAKLLDRILNPQPNVTPMVRSA